MEWFFTNGFGVLFAAGMIAIHKLSATAARRSWCHTATAPQVATRIPGAQAKTVRNALQNERVINIDGCIRVVGEAWIC